MFDFVDAVEAAGDADAVPVAASLEPVSAVLSVWLILINCSRLFTFTN
jgi:hypothetical protein